MNIKECKDEALKLIERYSITGQSIALSYNGQSDYLLRMNGLINDAVMTIGTTVKRIPHTEAFTLVTSTDEWTAKELTDVFARDDGRGVTLNGEKIKSGVDYKWRDSDTILVKGGLEGELVVYFYRYPTLITSSSVENTQLDNTLDTHIAVPYYVASMLIQQDNPYLAATLYNTFETKLSRIREGVEVDISQIEDAYGFWG